MPSPPETTLQKRLRQRMQEKELMAAPLATKAGLSASFVRDILRGKTKSPSVDNLAKLARLLDTTPAYLTGQIESAELGNRKPLSSRGIPYRGEVAAGVWIEVGEGLFEPDDWLPINPVPHFPDGSVYCLTVRGDSIDKVATPGATLVCVDLTESGLAFKDGDLVIVERAREQQGLLEMTAKRVRAVRGGFELYPQSSNPKWQPVTFPREGNDDGETVRVLARVEYILNRP